MFTCLSCQVGFAKPENQREHFQSDWHRYNLKRKVAELPPVSAESFQERVLAHQLKAEESVSKSTYCAYCRRVFKNAKSYENHEQSKKHKENLKSKKDIVDMRNNNIQSHKSKSEESDVETDDEIEEVDSDEWEGDPIPPTDCLFCPCKSSSFESNMSHMAQKHSFFVPDLQFCVDLHGLIEYLGEKIGCGMICIWCNERSKHFSTTEGAQTHMREKGHCMMKFEGETLVEYSDFFDYSSSYPDSGLNADPDEEFEPQRLISDGYELPLPSGITIGHRSLLRYYKQRLNPNRKEIVPKSGSSVRAKVMAQYKALGWSGASKVETDRRARDINFMHSVKNKHQMRLGVKANKLQNHFRPQVLF